MVRLPTEAQAPSTTLFLMHLLSKSFSLSAWPYLLSFSLSLLSSSS